MSELFAGILAALEGLLPVQYLPAALHALLHDPRITPGLTARVLQSVQARARAAAELLGTTDDAALA